MDTLKGEEKFFCNACGTYQEAQKRTRLSALPDVLLLHLNRFKYTTHMDRFVSLWSPGGMPRPQGHSLGDAVRSIVFAEFKWTHRPTARLHRCPAMHKRLGAGGVPEADVTTGVSAYAEAGSARLECKRLTTVDLVAGMATYGWCARS